jgi:mono/diheme cytochrome c family protein
MRIDEPVSSTCMARIAAMVALGTLLIGACLVEPTRARADQGAAEGKRIWAEKGQCEECHGWAADGHSGFHSPGKPPSLRTTQLTRDEIRMTIQCGRPGTPMPHFDRFAYTDKRCYGMTAEELGDATPVQGAPALQTYEIDALADYIATQLKGAGPVYREDCNAWFKSESAAGCNIYPKRPATN